jgi:hypothetical protein
MRQVRVVVLLVLVGILTFGMQWADAAGKGGGKTPPPIPLAQTGQTAVVAAGDDGDYQLGVAIPSPRFTDAGDAAVDNLTGLMWLKDLNCIATNYPEIDQDELIGNGAVSWQHALDFIAGINAGTYPKCSAGHTDWRLPNIHELMSLLDYSGDGPNPLFFLPADNLFFNVPSPDGLPLTYYWSSTSLPISNGLPHAFLVGFLSAEIHSYMRAWSLPVLPVRGGKATK